MSIQQHKSFPLTKEEVMMLVDLVETHPVLTSKATNATNNQLKQAVWVKITDKFNSMICSPPRKPEQLRLKWENLKKAARKRNSKIRMNNLKTGGGDYIPPDDILEKVASILAGATCDGHSIPFESDAERSVDDKIDIIYDNSKSPILKKSPAHRTTTTKTTTMTTTIKPPPAKKFFFSSVLSKDKLKRLSTWDVRLSVIARNRAIAMYYKEKKKKKEVLWDLKKKKLQLEILELTKKL